MATLRIRQGVYFIDYYLDGKRIRKSVGRSKSLAELALKNLQKTLGRNAGSPERVNSELEYIMDKFLIYARINQAPNSYKKYTSMVCTLKGFLSLCPDIKKFSQLTPRFFSDYEHYRKDQGIENVTINRELGLLRSLKMMMTEKQWGEQEVSCSNKDSSKGMLDNDKTKDLP